MSNCPGVRPSSQALRNRWKTGVRKLVTRRCFPFQKIGRRTHYRWKDLLTEWNIRLMTLGVLPGHRPLPRRHLLHRRLHPRGRPRQLTAIRRDRSWTGVLPPGHWKKNFLLRPLPNRDSHLFCRLPDIWKLRVTARTSVTWQDEQRTQPLARPNFLTRDQHVQTVVFKEPTGAMQQRMGDQAFSSTPILGRTKFFLAVTPILLWQ